jgi:hypothetical protein
MVGTTTYARTIDARPADYVGKLSRLMPGDTLELAPGNYLHGLPIHRLNGTSDAPIRIAPQNGEKRPRFIARPGRNTVSIVDSSFVEIVGLELDGAGLQADGVKAEARSRFAHHITVEDLLITGHGADQQIVGISTMCPAWNWVIRRNIIIGAGTGLYLGDSDGSAPFVAGVIEHNLVRDTRGYNLQIKHQRPRPDLPGMPAVPSVTVIRHNVFSKAENASTASLARPNVLVGHFPPAGPGTDDTYLIYGNFFYENPTEALFQGEGNIALYSNVFVNMSGSAIHVQAHKGRPERVDVFGNTVVAREGGILISGANPEKQQRVFRNLVFAGLPIHGGQPIGNVTGELQAAEKVLTKPFSRPGTLSLAPKKLDSAPPSRWPTLPERYVDADRDFDSAARGTGGAGAYVRQSAAWLLAMERKPAMTSGGQRGPWATGSNFTPNVKRR